MSTEGSGETASVIPNLPGAPEQVYLFPKVKGHSRSISHGGTPMLATNPVAARPPLKSAMRGHQRALSHGQIGEEVRSAAGSGHSRTGSRTDFILPPGHREHRQPTASCTVARTSSVRGSHSRQGSRSDSIYTLRNNSVVSPWRRTIMRLLRRQPQSLDLRNTAVIPNHLVPDKTPPQDHPNGKRPGNKVRTTKYTLLSFLPKNLFEQFHRIANVYFIFIVLLNFVPALNAFGKEVAMLPVLFVLSVTAIKDLFEDRRRHRSDKKINNSICRVYKKSSDRYVQVRWAEVRVGDIVHLSNNEAVPADIVLLRSSHPLGVCYLDTCNLDGETSLKQRAVAPGFREKALNFKPNKFKSTIEVEPPSTKIYRFNGTIANPNGKRVIITSEHLLLRDCTIKNTDFVEGIVVYAGHETKAMLNNGGPRYKCSRLEKMMNTDIIWCVLVLLFLCCVGAIGCKLWLDQYPQIPPFIPYSMQPAYEGMLIFWTYIIVLQVMIPVSLYVSIEMTKLMQVYHIHHDADMYDVETNTRTECRALNITEELGQVAYLFTDKTGTLTENKMVFRRAAVGGVDYDHPDGPMGEPMKDLPPIVTPNTIVSPNKRMLQHVLDSNESQHTQKVREFLMVLALCNTVMVSQPHVDSMLSEDWPMPSGAVRANGNLQSNDKYSRLAESRSTTPSPPRERPTTPTRLKLTRIFKTRETPAKEPIHSEEHLKVHFEAESPDELALAEAALAYGYELRKRGPDELELGVRGLLRRVHVLRVQPFDNVRRCMSIALRLPEADGQVVLYVKGADTNVLSALAPMRAGSVEAAALETTKNLLNEYAREGLRTLVMAKRVMSMTLWEEWLAGHTRIHELHEGAGGRDRRLRESLARLESALTLVGATGVEDRLQEDVPQTIRALIDAGIIVWVLTGDKAETAVNIAYSASIFSPTDNLMYVISRDKEHAERKIKGYLEQLGGGGAGGGAGGGGRALVVDGRTLTYILDRRSGLFPSFLALARRCSAVLCCRATPLQKAYIVKAVKEELDVTTLAIGDGANDVSMIQTADVGVGLSGSEGRQAVMAADFTLTRFKYLKRLLLVHGHWSYDRLARMVHYFFLKNAAFVFLVFWYQIYNGFSTTVMIDQLHWMLYNLMFTAFPPLVIGVYDRAAPDSLLMERPGLYSASRRGLAYRRYSYWIIIVEAIYMSLVIFFMTVYALWDTDVDLWSFGVANMSCCLIVMLSYVALETHSWTVIHLLAVSGSMLAFFTVTLVYQSVCVTCFCMPSTYKVMQNTISRPYFWLLVFLTTVTALTPRLAMMALRNSCRPTVVGRAVRHQRRRAARLPYAAQYHTPSASAHVYRSTDEEGLSKRAPDVTAIT